MNDELATILRLVSEGALSPEEAAPIIEALNRAPGGGTQPGLQPGVHPEHGAAAPDAPSPPPSPERRPGDVRQMRIRVMERGRKVMNLRIPVAFTEMALRMVPGISAEQGGRIRQAIAENLSGPILDVEDEDGDGVLITME